MVDEIFHSNRNCRRFVFVFHKVLLELSRSGKDEEASWCGTGLIKPGGNFFYTLFSLYEDSYNVNLDYSDLEQVIDTALGDVQELKNRQLRRYEGVESWMGYNKAVRHPEARNEMVNVFKDAFARSDNAESTRNFQQRVRGHQHLVNTAHPHRQQHA